MALGRMNPARFAAGVGEEGVTLVCSGPLRCRIGARDELRRDLTGRSESGVIQSCEILADRSTSPGTKIVSAPLVTRNGALFIGIGSDEARVHLKPVAAHQAFAQAAFHHGLEETAHGAVERPQLRAGAPKMGDCLRRSRWRYGIQPGNFDACRIQLALASRRAFRPRGCRGSARPCAWTRRGKRAQRRAAEESHLDVLRKAMKTEEPALALDAIERRVPFDRLRTWGRCAR